MLNLLGFLRNPIIASALALLVGLSAGFLRGYSAGSDAERVSQLEAELAAERDRARREAALARRLEREKNDLENALREIDNESPITGDGADVRLGPDFLCRIRAKYDSDIGCGPPIPSRN